MTSGMDLKVERVRSRVRAVQVASEMVVSRQRIAQIEALAVVEPEMAIRYRMALVSVTMDRQTPASAP